MLETPVDIRANMERIQERIALAAQRAGRRTDEIQLVVVTKGHPAETVMAAVDAGARLLGENYVEEGVTKMLACALPLEIEWHMIGHVQSRKARGVAQHYFALHSLDSLKLARRLSNFCGELGSTLPVLLQCNVSGEESKEGWPAWDEAAWPALLPELGELLALPHLHPSGLMTMAPFLEDGEAARPYFERLRRLQGYLSQQFPACDWRQLSMGMSGDFEAAIQEGATLVRIGTAIVGPRACSLP